MKRIRRKLHSRRGASILLALLLMLVATMVSAVILSASVTAAKRVHDDEEEQQDYLYVSSAAGFFADCLRRSNCTLSKTVVTQRTKDGTELPQPEPEVSFLGSWPTPDDNPLGPVLSDCMRNLASGLNDYAYPYEITLRIPGISDPAYLKSFVMRTYGDAEEQANGVTTYRISAVVTADDCDSNVYLYGSISSIPNWTPTSNTTTEELENGDDPITQTETEWIQTWEWENVVLTTQKQS